ncbi:MULTISPECIES: hypothetical protein [unclassified Variovorax]|uniref:hypothetical protein n=1 Tax=unclassified Variovorax TaxID=663243 RepID=UPI003F470D14
MYNRSRSHALRISIRAVVSGLSSVFLLACAPAERVTTPNSELCNKPEIAAVNKAKRCGASLVKFRDSGGKTSNATLATVYAGRRKSYDVIAPIIVYFLQPPDGKLVALGEFPAWTNYAELLMYSQLKYDPSRGGGMARPDNDVFYDRLIERQGDRYCSVLSMKPPFAGELIDCAENERMKGITGKVDYMPGVLSQQAVAQRFCERFASERGLRCEHNVVSVSSSKFERDEAGLGRYRVTVQSRSSLENQRSGRYQVEIREYLASADGISHQETSREWEECVSGTCTPSRSPP